MRTPDWEFLNLMTSRDSATGLTAFQMDALESGLMAERERALARLEASERTLADIVSYSEGSPPDDEHDPEGSTIAYERAQVSALITQSRDHLAGLDQALGRLRNGTYGVCERCCNRIVFERLLARPTARTCVGCAAG